MYYILWLIPVFYGCNFSLSQHNKAPGNGQFDDTSAIICANFPANNNFVTLYQSFLCLRARLYSFLEILEEKETVFQKSYQNCPYSGVLNQVQYDIWLMLTHVFSLHASILAFLLLPLL